MSTDAAAIADFLGVPLHGPNVPVTHPRSLTSIDPGSMVFAKTCPAELVAQLNAVPGTIAVVPEAAGDGLTGAHVRVPQPRVAFARVVAQFFADRRPGGDIASTAVVGQNVHLGQDVTVGQYTVIGDNVTIGDRTEIRHHVVIAPGVTIGDDCLIKSHAAIGEEGFGIVYDEAGDTLRVPHVGTVVIGNRVEIGCFTTVARATIDTTRVGDGTKTDDHVHIGHNSTVGDNCILTAYAEIGAEVVLEDHVWMGVKACTHKLVRIGAWGYVGMGAVVREDVPPRAVVVGVPARYLRDRLPGE